MQAAIFDAVGQPLRVTEVPDPAPMAREVIVKSHRCGICGSDLHMTSGDDIGFPSGCIMGHEISGEVVELGSEVDSLSVGDRVAVLPALSCGVCAASMQGKPARCAAFQALGCGVAAGGYAEYVRATAAYCLPLPVDLTYEDGALTEPLAVAHRGVGFAKLRPGSRVLVIGIGPIGLAAIFWARRMGGTRIVATSPTRRRAANATSFGADSFVRLHADMKSEVFDQLGGPPDVIIECAGQPGLIATAIDLVAFGGTVVVLGLCTRSDTFQPSAALLKEVTIQFSIVYDLQDYRAALAILAAGAPEPRTLISARVTLDQLPVMFESLRQRNDHCKVMVSPSDRALPT